MDINGFFYAIVGGIAGGCLTLIGVFVQHMLDERAVKKCLFKALHDEVTLNFSVAQENLEIKNVQGVYLPDMKFLYTLSYQNIRASGELLSLPRDLRRILEETFNLVYYFNQCKEQNRGWATSNPTLLDDLVKNLKHISEELPKNLKFLK